MLILGITGSIDSLVESTILPNKGIGHDSAAVLLENAEVISGIEEERINRIKHTNKLCSFAVSFCLEVAQKTLDDLDAIAIYASEDYFNHILKEFRLHTPD
ncbi:MAG: carbamoyltransferase N-terminal domain-containing protein [Methylobacter sp.]